jgi:hypothetical protein
MINIKQALVKNPELKKPLLILKNIAMSKAFNKLHSVAQISKSYVVNKDTSMFALYLRLLRKAFYGFKMYKSQNDDRRRIKLLRNLFI